VGNVFVQPFTATATGTVALRLASAPFHLSQNGIGLFALCGGAGDSLLAEPAVTGADVYITSDLRHHPAQESRERSLIVSGPALIDVSHWASEWLWLETAADQLRAALPSVEVLVSDERTDPWDFVVVQ